MREAGGQRAKRENQEAAKENTAMGTDAMLDNSTGIQNTAAGFGALLYGKNAMYNSAFGVNALGNNSGNRNTAIGWESLNQNTTGEDNTATGYFSMSDNTVGIENAAYGIEALMSNLSGSDNAAFGALALFYNQASYNTAMGWGSLYFNVNGVNNVAAGYDALQANDSGILNSAVGSQALFSNASGSNNTAIGDNALFTNTVGLSNTAVGANAGYSIKGNSNIDIGNEGLAADNGTIRIGTETTQSAVYIAGISTSAITGAAVYVNSHGKLGVLASSERYKTAITPMTAATSKLEQLRPVTFHLKTDPRGAVQYGLIAEEVDKVYPELVIHDAAGRIQGVRYDELAPILLKEVQQLHDHQKTTDAQLSALIRQNEAMQAAMFKLIADSQRVAMR